MGYAGMGFADMHIHSIYSDGTLMPEEIVETARASGVALLSVCDHNELRGTLQTMELARAAGINCVGGVEIDALHRGLDLHILCYGADLTHAGLVDTIRRARHTLDEMSTQLLLRMQRASYALDRIEYEQFTHDVRRGGWKMLQYLQAKGITSSLREGFALYDKFSVGYADAPFDLAQDVVQMIHAAGGRAVLAHPGVVFDISSMSHFAMQVEDALALGMDGVECYYPRHDAGLTRTLLEICERRGCMVTAGSDCHGAFNHNEIGQTRTPVSALRLNGLL